MTLMNRRQALTKTLLGTVGGLTALDGLSSTGWVEKLLLPSLGGQAGTNPFLGGAVGTLEILQSALRGGVGFLRTQQALASTVASDPAKEWAVVTIKVVNHVHTPLVFKLGKLDPQSGNVTTASDVDTVVSKLSTSGAHMGAKGVDKLSDNPRYSRLRFNKWFADILQSGKSDVETSAGVPSLDAATIFPGAGAFPSGVAIQAGLHLAQEFTTKNHSLMNFRVRQTEGDLAHFLEKRGIVRSPLGVTAFMMGEKYDKAEGSFDRNVVLGDANGVENPIAQGASVAQIVNALSQSVAGGYADMSTFNSNLTVKFDRLVESDPKLRRALLESKVQFESSLADLKKYASLEGSAQTGVTAASGSLQGSGNGTDPSLPPSREFVAQCGYAARALKMDGRPVRNFSLFLNMSDLDGKNLDEAFFGGAAEGIKCYSYVEGMRQLAVGLNILAKVIDEKRNVIVVVVSEGGRKRTLGDDHVSFGLVLGPSGPGLLTDHLYAHTELINEESNALVKDPGAFLNMNDPSTWVRWNVDGLVSESGASMKGMRATTSGDWQLGVAEFVAEKMGVTGSMAGQLQYVKLKRG